MLLLLLILFLSLLLSRFCFESIRLQSICQLYFFYFPLDIPTPSNQPLLFYSTFGDAYTQTTPIHIYTSQLEDYSYSTYTVKIPYTQTHTHSLTLSIAIHGTFVGLRTIHFVRLFSVSKQIWCGAFVFLCVYFFSMFFPLDI